MNISELTISQLRSAYTAGDITPVEALRALAGEIDARDPGIGAYLSYDLDRALVDAQSADLSQPLGGIPILLKDLISAKGHPLSCASKFLENTYTAPYDATVVRKLREAGAIPFGRANMDEFAMGSTNENSAIKLCRNPHDLERVPGGSSGGSAAAVAANLAIASLGSDTGGSIRQPASHCGVVGLKPSYGRVSRYGLAAFASSLDQCGPITKTVADTARLLEVIAGGCDYDSTCISTPVPRYSEEIGKDITGLRIGLPTEYFAEGLDPAIRERIESAMKTMESLGATIIPVSLPHTEYVVAIYYIIATAEASSNLARIDGVRYGRRAEASDLTELYEKSRGEGFGSEVKRRILFGTHVLSSGYYDAYYLRAQKARTLIRQDFESAFSRVDLIAAPVSPTPPVKIGEAEADPLRMYLADIYTISANLTGICALSVPCGTVSVEGKPLPVGLQLLGKPFGEVELLRAAHAYEQARG